MQYNNTIGLAIKWRNKNKKDGYRQQNVRQFLQSA